MGTATAARALTAGCYLTDESLLLYVLTLTIDGEATVENVRTGEISCIRSIKLDGWRFVDPEHDGA